MDKRLKFTLITIFLLVMGFLMVSSIDIGDYENEQCENGQALILTNNEWTCGNITTGTAAISLNITGSGDSGNLAVWLNSTHLIYNTTPIGSDGTGTSGIVNDSDARLNYLSFIDNKKLTFGTSADSSMYYDGTDLKINSKEVGSGSITLNSFQLREDLTGHSVYLTYPNISSATGSFNLIMGELAGRLLTSGSYNVIMGYSAGPIANNSNYNVFLGTFTGKNSYGTWNTFIGYNAGGSNNINGGSYNLGLGGNSLRNLNGLTSSYNIGIGTSAGQNVYNGNQNTFIGYASGYNVVNGSDNMGIGSNTLYNSKNQVENTAIGTDSLYNARGNSNVAIGYRALRGITAQGGPNAFNTALGSYAGYYTNGSNNVFIGYESGRFANPFQNSIFIGYKSGYYINSSNTLIIDSIVRTSATDTLNNALIVGNFNSTTSAQWVKINGNLTVNGNINVSGCIIYNGGVLGTCI